MKEYGGYFELELNDFGDLYQGARYFQSARASLRAVFEASQQSVVYMPYYICKSVVYAAKNARKNVVFYQINETLMPKIPFSFPESALLLYVNYFGLCQNNIHLLLNVIPKKQLVIDNSHALFEGATDALATIYSPRKFVGVPDGGIVIYRDNERPLLSTELDQESDNRMAHLCNRITFGARYGYSFFNGARESLDDDLPRTMSKLTSALLKNIQWDEIRRIRQRNFDVFNKQFSSINAFDWKLINSDVPLCYPLGISGHKMQEIKIRLAEIDIFVPTYWPECNKLIEDDDNIVRLLMKNTLFLPIDQRLELKDVFFIIDSVKAHLAEYSVDF